MFTAKNKIYLAVFLWLVLCASMFGYFFSLLNKSNKELTSQITAKSRELQLLEAEQQSYKQAKTELDKLKRERYQPERFFSKDAALVDEIRTIEKVAGDLNLDITINGLRGTLKEHTKANTQSEVYVVPFSMNVVGTFADTVTFMETLENLHFITNVNTVSVNAGSAGQVNAALVSNFYLKKQ
jgi:Tfp pilus assembly protein PilO